MKFEGTKTEENLHTSMANEAIGHFRYQAFAQVAEARGYPALAQLFKTLAENEATHAQLLYDSIHEENQAPEDILKRALGDEHNEWTELYPGYADTAEEEGLHEIADLFRQIAKVERDHEFRFRAALHDLENANLADAKEQVAARQPDTVQGYRCVQCGTLYEKKPDLCKLCRRKTAIIPDTFPRSELGK